MFAMTINQSPVWYAHIASKEPRQDEYGNKTGEYDLTYTEPIQTYANISPARGEYDVRQFGELGRYDKVLIADDTDIKEGCILWIDSLSNGAIPVDPDGEPVMHDYEVTKVAPSLNSVLIAVRKVNVSR